MPWPAYVTPRIASLFEERNRLWPGARGAPGAPPGIPSSDGTLGDTAHQAEGAKSDHNIGAHGKTHAGDFSQSMPGTPYWDNRCQECDIFGLFRLMIADWYALAPAARVRKYHWLKYLVWNEGGHELIWSPARASEGIRRNGTNTGHMEHGHISINDDPASENDTQPIFATLITTEEDDVTPEQLEAAVEKALGGVKDGKAYGPVAAIVKHYIPTIVEAVCDELVIEPYDVAKLGRVEKAIKRYRDDPAYRSALVADIATKVAADIK